MNRRALLLCAAGLIGACGVSATIGSRWLASGMFTAATGGTLTVSSSASPLLAGASLQLGGGALAANAVINVGPGASQATSEQPSAGPAVDWDPNDLPLFLPAAFTLPVALPAGQTPDQLVVIAVGPDGTEVLSGPDLDYDESAAQVRFAAMHLGTFQALAVLRCQGAPDNCPLGDFCDRGQCRPADDNDGGYPPGDGGPHP